MSHKRKSGVKFFAILCAAVLLIALTATWTLTEESNWYPSKWGKRRSARRSKPVDSC